MTLKELESYSDCILVNKYDDDDIDIVQCLVIYENKLIWFNSFSDAIIKCKLRYNISYFYKSPCVRVLDLIRFLINSNTEYLIENVSINSISDPKYLLINNKID